MCVCVCVCVGGGGGGGGGGYCAEFRYIVFDCEYLILYLAYSSIFSYQQGFRLYGIYVQYFFNCTEIAEVNLSTDEDKFTYVISVHKALH